ncbi:MAG: threonine/serine exporter family protein, partial [Clostridia bacterium]|nr:threonine/serine exporter family protein [Clostridia bacterium]
MTQELLRCIVELCEQMVCSGAEVYRVEDSIERMCTAYGAVRVDAYVT